jgi:4'-phosphopantetheinyl transferase
MRVDEGQLVIGATRDIRVWRVDLRQPAAWVDEAKARVLAPEEQELGARATPLVGRRRLVARAALRIAVSHRLRCPPAALRFGRDPNGKPKLADADAGGRLHFNIARSGDCCLIALTTIGPIGVDVEHVVAFPELEQVVMRFAPEETAAIVRLAGEHRLRAFYNCWTRKEAYLKARGVGLTGALDKFAVTVDDERAGILRLDDDPRAWTLAAVDPGPTMIGAVAISGAHELSGGAVETAALPLDLESG